MNSHAIVRRSGLDGVALKPREVDLASVSSLPFDQVTVDFEGADAVPASAALHRLADLASLRVTIPVRATGFDPLGDDRHWASLPPESAVALVAGNPAYLTREERRRAIAPRLTAAVDRAPDAWVGTEGIEVLALSTGATQFELLGPETERWVRDRRAAGFDGAFAVYAPTVLTDDDDAVLDALGPYVARRHPVATALPADTATDSSARGRARQVLLDACGDYAVTGDLAAVRERVDALRGAGVEHVVGYPPRGLDAFLGDR